MVGQWLYADLTVLLPAGDPEHQSWRGEELSFSREPGKGIKQPELQPPPLLAPVSEGTPSLWLA